MGHHIHSVFHRGNEGEKREVTGSQSRNKKAKLQYKNKIRGETGQQWE